MREVNATEAKARLAELLRSVEFGEAVAITRHGKAIAHLIPAREHDPQLWHLEVRSAVLVAERWGRIR
jgi:prevent-host-death family protein